MSSNNDIPQDDVTEDKIKLIPIPEQEGCV
jgi:hypothetical protein